MMRFELTLENKKRKYYHNLALFIILLNLAVLAILAFYTTGKWIFWNCMVAILVMAAMFIIEWYSLKKRKQPFNAIGGALFYATLSWALMLFWWAAAISMVLWLFYIISNRPMLVTFLEKGISYPSFPRRIVEWNELTNAILKDDLLTIDFKNNKILQQLVEKTPKSVDEKEFNDFCRTQLKFSQTLNK